MKINRLLLSAFCMLMVCPITLRAETKTPIQHQSPTVVTRGEVITLNFSAPSVNPDNVRKAVLYYRFNNAISFSQKEASFSFSDFTVSLDLPENATGSLEYYFKIYFKDNNVQTWPLNYNIAGPAQVEIVQPRQSPEQESPIQYTILTPQPGETVSAQDALIAITLFYDEADVDTSKISFRLYLDGNDITEKADASSYFFSYVPEQLSPGEHYVTLKLVTESSVREIATWNFTSTNTMADNNMMAVQPPDERFFQTGRVELQARNQVISGNSNDIFSGNIRVSGGAGSIRYTAYGTLTSQENERLQPQNRYGLELYAGNWLELRAGDIYPFLSPLTIAGRRVRGINAAIHFFDHAINMEFLYGNMRRSVNNLYGIVQPDIKSFNGSAVDTTYFLNFDNGGTGTFQREVMGGRLSFGGGRTFQFGINVLKIQDDTTSINLIENYNDALQMFPNTLANLSADDRQKLQNNPGLLTVNGNPTPKGNMVATTDLMFALDNSNIRFSGNAGVSLLNNDISGGILDSEAAEQLGFDLDSNTENLLDRLSWLIIINENMSALPIQFQENGEGVDPYVPSSIFAGQSMLSFLYFENTLNIKYRWIGPDFESLANSTIRNDIAGITVTDRFNLFDNRIYITLGYENLQDNVSGTEDATTKTISYRGNVSWYPIEQNLPRVSIGLMYRNRDNGVALYNPSLNNTPYEKAAVLNYKQAGGQTTIAATPRSENTLQLNTSLTQEFNLFGVNNTARLSYSLLNTTDEVFAYGDTRSSVVSFNLINRFVNMPVQTTIGVSYNSTETLSGAGSIDIFGINVGGSVFLLDDKLNVDVAIALTQNEAQFSALTVNENGAGPADNYYTVGSSSTTDSQAYIFSASARYNITPHHAILLNSRITNVTGTNFNLPNDRLLQARYIFSF